MVDLTNCTVLVVDDAEANIDILVEVLGDDFNISVAMDGESALEIVADEKPDLILLDVMMPGMDGYEVCEQLKESEETRNIPIIFLTAMAEEHDEVMGLALGAVDYVTKPFSPELVKSRVKTHLALYKQSRELESSYKRLQRMEELRDNLVHMLVHDMRSPLSVMLMTFNMLKDDLANKLSEDNRQSFDYALSSTEDLIKMVSDLLDISQMESGKMPLEIQPVNVVGIVRNAMEQVRKLAEGINLSLEADPEDNLIDCDPKIVDRVVSNLLHNALKFTPVGGSVSITVAYREGDVEVVVSDTGPGIPEEFQDHIFDKFGQTRESRQHTSSGLGLTFCKMAVETHQGEIGVDSQVGKGSRFWFTLPIQRVEEI